jgi:hypothetical protein
MLSVHAKFHEDWFRHSEVDRGRIHRYTDSTEIT